MNTWAGSARNRIIAAHFAKAAGSYDTHAPVQREVALRLAEAIASLPLPSRPRILEIGCGTGFLTHALADRLGPADWTITDIAAPMVAAVQAGAPLPGIARFMVGDGERFIAPDGARYDLICSSLAVQWFEELNSGLAHLAMMLAPGGYLALSTLAEGTFAEWQAAHDALGLRYPGLRYPALSAIGEGLPVLRRKVWEACERHRFADGLQFVRGLKQIGATAPRAGAQPLRTRSLKQVLTQFERQGATVSYHVAYGIWEKPAEGVFVTGTDTGVGKTLVSAVLCKAWHADYWKPVQTGLADEPGDTATVAGLAGCQAPRLHAPMWSLQASLSPWAAARLEGVVLDASQLMLPRTKFPLVVEGAGGLYVPIDDTCMMIDLIARLKLPAVLVARSGLGTINHTLLSLHALRRQNIEILGVVMNGPASPGNKEAIEKFGRVRVLFEIPAYPGMPDADTVGDLAANIPPFKDVCATAS